MRTTVVGLLTLVFLSGTAVALSTIESVPTGRRHVRPVAIEKWFTAYEAYRTAYYTQRTPEGLNALIASLTEGLKQYPDDTELHRLYQDVMRQSGKGSEVDQEYRAKLAAEPDRALWNYLVARLSADPAEQKRLAEQAVKLDPTYYWGHLMLGTVLEQSGKGERSVAEYHRAIKIDNSLYPAFTKLGDYYAAHDESTAALRSYAAAAVCAPDEPRVTMTAVRFAEAVKNDNVRLKVLRLGELPGFERAMYENLVGAEWDRASDIGFAYLGLGRVDSAAASFARALEIAGMLGPDWQAESYYNLARFDGRRGLFDSAFTYLELAVRNGFTDYRRMAGDTDLVWLSSVPRWHGLTQQMEREAEDKLVASRVEEPAPAFALKDRDGAIVAFKDLAGKPVFLEFWATWCHWCMKALPLYQKFYEQHRADAYFFAVNTEGEDIRAKADSVFRDNGWTVPVLFADKATVEAYQAKAIPRFVVIDRRGTISFIHEGYSEALEEILGIYLRELMK